NNSCIYNYLISCFAIKIKNPSAMDGFYDIDPDGSDGEEPPLEVYCDMTTGGGGWTRLNSNTANTERLNFQFDGSISANNNPNSVCAGTNINYKIKDITVPYSRVRLDLTKTTTILQCAGLRRFSDHSLYLPSRSDFYINGSNQEVSADMCSWGPPNTINTGSTNLNTTGLPLNWRTYGDKDPNFNGF